MESAINSRTEHTSTYYTDTGPSAHKLPSDEVARYEGNPPSVVGRKFVPGNGDDLWEITEVTYGQKGWSSLTLHVEGSEQNRRMVLDDFFALLKNGTVKGLDE